MRPSSCGLATRRAAMEHYVGLDVSLKQTSICVVNQVGSIVREGVVDSNPEAIAAFVRSKAPGAMRPSSCGLATMESCDGTLCIPGELIPCAFVWHDPGITPCCKSPKSPDDNFPAKRRSD